jgi:hypothetical protein
MTLRDRLAAGARLREGSAELARRIAAAIEAREVDDAAARVFFEQRERLAPGFGVAPTGVVWRDVPVNERLLTAAALRELVARRVLPVAVSR